MKISEVQRHNVREQRVILNKISTRRQKVAALLAEIEQLQSDLVQVTAENIAWWDGHVPTDYTEPEQPCSEVTIPLPSGPAEKIFIGATTYRSSFE